MMDGGVSVTRTLTRVRVLESKNTTTGRSANDVADQRIIPFRSTITKLHHEGLHLMSEGFNRLTTDRKLLEPVGTDGSVSRRSGALALAFPYVPQ
jgi:hypothetical protein